MLTPPPKPHFYIVKLGLQEYTLYFLFLLKNIDCGNSLSGSNEFPQFMFEQKYEKYQNFYLKTFSFGGEIFNIFE